MYMWVLVFSVIALEHIYCLKVQPKRVVNWLRSFFEAYCEPKLNDTMRRKIDQMRGTAEVFGRK